MSWLEFCFSSLPQQVKFGDTGVKRQEETDRLSAGQSREDGCNHWGVLWWCSGFDHLVLRGTSLGWNIKGIKGNEEEMSVKLLEPGCWKDSLRCLCVWINRTPTKPVEGSAQIQRESVMLTCRRRQTVEKQINLPSDGNWWKTLIDGSV